MPGTLTVLPVTVFSACQLLTEKEKDHNRPSSRRGVGSMMGLQSDLCVDADAPVCLSTCLLDANAKFN